MKAFDNYVAIDPDTQKSGVAFIEAATRKLEVSALTFPELIDYLKWAKRISTESGQTVLIAIEAGWLNSISNYHTAANRAGQRIAKNVGANHAVGKLTVETARNMGLEVVEQKPLRKIWKKGKISMDELNSLLQFKKMGTLDRRVNQDCRDSVLLALFTANIL